MTGAIARRGKIAILTILAVALTGAATTLLTRAQATPSIWTDKADYAPDELVDIHGSGFLPNGLYRVLVVWPDGSARVSGNNGVEVCTDPTVADGTMCYQEVTADADGTFKLWYQLLNGQKGPYQVHVYDQTATVVATGSFTDDASGPPPTGSHSHLVLNANDLPGQAQPPDATAFESQRKVFKSRRGARHLYALATVSNNEVSPPGLSGGLWLLRSTDNGTTWSSIQRLKRDNSNPPNVSGSLWTYDDGTQLVVYVTYAQGNGSSLWYRRVLISDDGTVAVGAEQTISMANIGNPDQSVRPVIVQDRNLRVHIAYRRTNGTMSIVGTVSPTPDDTPTWSSAVDVMTSSGNNYLPALLPFGGSGNLLGYLAVARASSITSLFGRNIVDFNGVTYTLGTLQNLGAVSSQDNYVPLSAVVDGSDVAHMLYVKLCPNSGAQSCPGSSAGSGTGVFSRRASAANTVESWGTAVQVTTTIPATVSLSIETGVSPNRLFAFSGTNVGVVSFKSSNSDVISWGSTGCAGTGGTIAGSQCDITTTAGETNIDWLSSSVNGPIQILWTRLVAKSPVKHYYMDSAPPSDIDIAFAPDGTNGWHKTSPAAGSVTAMDDSGIQSINCTDSLGGLVQGALVPNGASASRSLTVSGESSNHNITCTAIDKAGNAVSASTTVKIDTTPPTIVGSRSPGPNGYGWNNSNITVSFTCSDALSGLAAGSPPANTLLSGDGADQSVTGTCTDQAGNSTSAAASGINIDKTAPLIAFDDRTPAPNGAGWNKTDVTVQWTCADSLSGALSAIDTVTLTTEGDNQSATGICEDRAGNSASDTQSGIKIDKTAPALVFGTPTPGANGAGWNNTDVSIPFTPSDNLSGVASTTPGASPLILSAEGMSVSSDVTVEDVAGNSATFTSPAFKIDKTPPVVSANPNPGPNLQGWNNTDVTVSFIGTDGLSDIASCAAPVVLTTETAVAGVTVSGTCTDNADNISDQASAVVRIDKTKPVLTHQASPAPNGAGWNNTNVTVSFDCSDTLSGVLSSSGSAEHSVEGITEVEGMCSDNAGNFADPITVTVRIDKTPPAYGMPARAESSQANGNGWNKTDVTVTFPCTDAVSGPVTNPVVKTLVIEGANQTLTAAALECVDVAGNAASDGASVAGISIDKTPPSYGIPTRASGSEENANHWNNGNVTVNFPCTDTLSGPVTNPVTTTLTTEGANQTAIASASECVDLADNPANVAAILADINIDKTSPAYGTPTQSPAANASGWNNTNVTVNFQCADALSGAVNDPVIKMLTAEGASQTATAPAAECIDKAGNHAAADASLSGVSIDKTPPAIAYVDRTPSPNDEGWNNTDVTVHWSCEDSLSQPVAATVSQTVSGEGTNQSATGTCTDRAGNTASNTQNGIFIDKTKPTLNPVVSPDPVILNGIATASSGAADGLSGIEYEGCPPVEVTSVGTKTLKCTATDVAGNSDEKTITYRVQYASGGSCLGVLGHAIMQPVNLDGSSVFKKGSTVPAKFRVCDAKGVSTGSPGVVAGFYRIWSQPGVVTESLEDVISTTPDTAFRWSVTDQLWIFNISTKDPALSANSTYLYRITLNDGTAIEFRFGLK